MSKKVFFIICVLAAILYLNSGLNILPCFSKEINSSISIADFPKIRDITLKNGLNVLIRENHNKKLVAIEVIVKTGSVYEGNLQGSGLAHLTEHMLFKGTAKRDALTIENEIKALGGYINGYTSHQITGYSLIIPSENFVNGLEILADMLMNPLIDENEIRKEKKVILNEIRFNHDDPERYLSQLFWKKAYPLAPFNQPIIGNEALFKRLTRKDIVDFHKKWYVPNNMIISIAGDVSQGIALQNVKANFSSLSMQPYPIVALPDIPSLNGQVTYEEIYDTLLCYMLIGFPSVVITDKDSAVLDITAALLAEGESSLFYRRLVREKQLVHSVSSFNYTPGFRGVFEIKCTLDPEKKAKVLQEIFAQLNTLKNSLLNANELKKVKKIFLADYFFTQETVASQAKTAAIDKAYTGNVNFSQSYIKQIKSITPADVRNCAKKYFSLENYAGVYLLPEQKREPFKKGSKIEDSVIKELRLKNGARVLLKHNSSLPLVSVVACFEGGVRMENGQNRGIFNILSRMLLKGTKKYSAEEISALFDRAGARIEPFSGYNSFGLRLDSMSEDLPRLLKVFCEILFDSNFKERELSLQKQLILKAIDRENDDIFKDSYNKLKESLFQSYPLGFNPLGKAETVASFNRSDLIKVHDKYVSADSLVLSVFGNFNEDSVLKYIEKFIPKSKKSTGLKQPVFNEPEKTETTHAENFRSKKQAIFMIGLPGCSLKNDDRYALEVLSSLLSGSGSILYQKIREKYGMAYTLGGASVNSLDSGFLFIYVATKPESLDKVKEIIFEEIKNIKAGNFDNSLLLNAKNFLIAQHRIQLEATQDLCFNVALNTLYGLGIDHHLKCEDNIKKVTKNDLINIAKKYLQIQKSAIIITKEKN